MTRILVTGSSDSLGLLTARSLIAQGHQVFLHARNPERRAQTIEKAPGAQEVLVADLSTMAGSKQLAAEANKHGVFDVVIHNAGVGYTGPYHKTADGFASTFAVNSLAPYILTCLMHRPKRLVYVSSGLHTRAAGGVEDITWTQRPWDAYQAYCDSKLQNIMLAYAVARRWKNVESVAMTPGWVATKIDDYGGPGKAEDGAGHMVNLASHPEGKLQSGEYHRSGNVEKAHPAASDIKEQEDYLEVCE